MGKEIHPEQSNQIRKRPVEFGSKLEKAKDQHSNPCCPNLNLDSIRRGPYKGFDLKILLQGLKKDFHLPPILVDSRNRSGPELQLIR
jgi:hypothetical protein